MLCTLCFFTEHHNYSQPFKFSEVFFPDIYVTRNTDKSHHCRIYSTIQRTEHFFQNLFSTQQSSELYQTINVPPLYACVRKIFWPKIVSKDFYIGNCENQICPVTIHSYFFESNLDTITTSNVNLLRLLHKELTRKINKIANGRLLSNEEIPHVLKPIIYMHTGYLLTGIYDHLACRNQWRHFVTNCDIYSKHMIEWQLA